MGTWIWGAAVMAIVVIIAGGIAWWLARGCVLTTIGAVGAVVGGVIALGTLAVTLDFDVRAARVGRADDPGGRVAPRAGPSRAGSAVSAS